METNSEVRNNIRKSTWITYFCSFLGDMSIGLYGFGMSLFTTLLLDKPSFSEAEKNFWISFVPMGWGIVYCISPIILGKLSDKIGRQKSIMIAMLGFLSINVLTPILATHPFHLFISYCFTSLTFGFYFPVLGALSSEVSEPFGRKIHSKVLSRFMISWSTGLTLGPLVGGTIYASEWEYTFIIPFILLTGFCIIITLASKIFIPRPEKLAADIKTLKAELDTSGSMENIEKNEHVKPSKAHLTYLKLGILMMAFIFSFVNQILLYVFPAFAETELNPGFMFTGLNNAFISGFLIFCLGIARTFAFWQVGSMDAKKKVNLILIGPIGIAATTLFTFLFKTADVLLFAFVGYGLFSGYTFAVGLILLMEISTEGKGMNAGYYEGAVGIGALASTLISSFIGQVNPSYPFLLNFLAATAVSIFLVIAYAMKRKKEME
ncbi:MAG: MFS transporter [Candidatus Hodarchaeota archaeon]